MPTDDEVRTLTSELRAAGGVGHGVDSLEVFLLFPDTFRRAYQTLCARALRPSIGDGAGRALDRQSELGRARVDGKHRGKRVGAGGDGGSSRRGARGGGGGAGGRTHKGQWVVADELALSVKTRIDRRLRVLARDLERMLEAREEIRVTDAGVTTSQRCAECGRFVERGWSYCPTCGNLVGVTVRVEGKAGSLRGEVRDGK